jgi:uncharacterized protein YfcZ (UPF0381/DUF406 family)
MNVKVCVEPTADAGDKSAAYPAIINSEMSTSNFFETVTDAADKAVADPAVINSELSTSNLVDTVADTTEMFAANPTVTISELSTSNSSATATGTAEMSVANPAIINSEVSTSNLNETTTDALSTLRSQKRQTVCQLPTTTDLIKLKDYCEKRVMDLTAALQNAPVYGQWRQLAEVVLSRLIVFNNRRGSEPAKLLVSEFTGRPKWATSANEEVMHSLPVLERKLMDRYVYFLNRLFCGTGMYVDVLVCTAEWLRVHESGWFRMHAWLTMPSISLAVDHSCLY